MLLTTYKFNFKHAKHDAWDYARNKMSVLEKLSYKQCDV